MNSSMPDPGPFYRDESRQQELTVTTAAVGFLGLFFVILRLVARRTRGIGLGADDVAMLVALGLLGIVVALNFVLIHLGLGLHADMVPKSNIVNAGMSLVAFECFYFVSIVTIKASILLMYFRVFPVRPVKVGCYVLGAITLCWGISMVLVTVFQCNPISKAWVRWAYPETPGHCVYLKGFFIGNAIPNILTDIAILCLPLPQIWKLNTTKMQRLALCFVFMLGTFVVFASIYRFRTLFWFNSVDFLYTLADANTWCVVEVSAGIISACLPTLAPLVRMVSHQFGGAWWTRSKSERRPGASGQVSRRPNLVTIGGTGSDRQSKTFQKLNDSFLRPHHGSMLSSKVERTVNENDSTEDLPLNAIKVRKEFEWTTSEVHIQEEEV